MKQRLHTVIFYCYIRCKHLYSIDDVKADFLEAKSSMPSNDITIGVN